MTEFAPPAAPATGRTRAARFGRGVLLALALVTIVAQSLVIASAGWAVTNPRAVTDAVTVWRYDPTPAISSFATRAGMSERGRFLFYASLPEVVPAEEFNAVCSREQPEVGVLGCYTLRDGRIYLYDIPNLDLEPFEVVVAAHEMLHAAWDRLPLDEQQSLVEPLEQAFATVGADSELTERIASYEAADPGSRIPELYAILGTELPELPDALEAHYTEYFDDRMAVVTLWQQVSTFFDDLENELVRLSDELERLAAEITTEQAGADQTAAALEADIAVFNERAERPGGYTSQSAFENDRQALIDRQAVLTATIDATNAKVRDYNALLDEFSALNEQAAALDKDLNIDPQRLEMSD